LFHNLLLCRPAIAAGGLAAGVRVPEIFRDDKATGGGVMANADGVKELAVRLKEIGGGVQAIPVCAKANGVCMSEITVCVPKIPVSVSEIGVCVQERGLPDTFLPAILKEKQLIYNVFRENGQKATVGRPRQG